MVTYTATLSNGETVTRTTKATWTHIVEFISTVGHKRSQLEDDLIAMRKLDMTYGEDSTLKALEALEGRESTEIAASGVYQWCKSEKAASALVETLTRKGYTARSIPLDTKESR